MSAVGAELNVRRLGGAPAADVRALRDELVERRRSGAIRDELLLGEPEPGRIHAHLVLGPRTCTAPGGGELQRELEGLGVALLADLGVEATALAGTLRTAGAAVGSVEACDDGGIRVGFLNLRVHADPSASERAREDEAAEHLAAHVDIPPGTILIEVLLVKHVCAAFELALPDPASDAGDAGNGFPQLPVLPG